MIEADRLKEVFHRNIVNGEAYDDLIDNAPTAEAIPKEQIDEMIAEIRDYSNKYTTINVNTKKVVVEALLCIIHKYCDKEQKNE